MTPKDCAKTLVSKFYPFAESGIFPKAKYAPESNPQFENARQSALICVSEIYKLKLEIGAYLDEMPNKENYYSYWEDVKSELENL